MSPPLFSLRVCIWRGFKTKYDVCHILCYEFFTLDHGRNLVGDVSPAFSGGGDIISHVPHFFSSDFAFGEVPKIKVMLATFCVKPFSCQMLHIAKLMLKQSLVRYDWILLVYQF